MVELARNGYSIFIYSTRATKWAITVFHIENLKNHFDSQPERKFFQKARRQKRMMALDSPCQVTYSCQVSSRKADAIPQAPQ